MASSRSGVADYARHSFGEPPPAFLFLLQAFLAQGRHRIEAGFAILLRLAPFGFDPALLLHAVQRGVERALLHAEKFLRYLMDAGRNGVPVHSLVGSQSAEDQKNQGPLKDVVFLFAHTDTYLAMPN